MKLPILPSIALLLTLTACESEEIKMNTIVRPDGSCRREICFKADSATLVRGCVDEQSNILGVLDYAAWTSEVQDTVWVKAHREFSSLDEMTSALPLRIAGEQVKSKATLEKRFRWFYTDYIFTETFESIAPLFEIPLSKYMDAEMADYWLTGTPDVFKGYSGMERKEYMDKMEENFIHFVNANILNDVIDILAEHYDSIPNPPVDKATFLARKEALIEQAGKGASDLLSFDAEKLLNESFSSEAYTNALRDNKTLARIWDERQETYLSVLTLDVDYQLTLPGGIIKVYESGDGVFRDGELHYRLSGLRLLNSSYTIRATSSGKNSWALYAALAIGIIALILCGMGLWRVWKGRKTNEV